MSPSVGKFSYHCKYCNGKKVTQEFTTQVPLNDYWNKSLDLGTLEFTMVDFYFCEDCSEETDIVEVELAPE